MRSGVASDGAHQTETERQKADLQERAGAGEPVQDEVDAEARKNRLQDKFNGMKDSLLGRIPDEHKDRASDQGNRVKSFLTDEYFPPERRDQFIFRLKKVSCSCLYPNGDAYTSAHTGHLRVPES